MAIYKPSPLISKLSGKLDTVVYSHTGLILTAKVYNPNPVNPNSERQETVRDAIKEFGRIFRGLTLQQRKEWYTVGKEIIPVRKDIDPGNIVTIPRGPLNNWNAFVLCNMNRYLSGWSQLTDVMIDPPFNKAKPEPLKSVSVVESQEGLTFSWTLINQGPRNERIEVWIKSTDARIHAQLIHTEQITNDGSVEISTVRTYSGEERPLPAGTYKLQAQVVNEYGLVSSPSAVVEVRLLKDIMVYEFSPFIANAIAILAYSGNTAMGDSDIYTVPTGKSAIILQGTLYNPSGGAITVYMERKTAGSYYRISSNVATGAGAGNTLSTGIVLDEGDSLSVNASAAGANIWIRVIEFDTNTKIKRVSLDSLAAGNNTLYTVPTGKSAQILDTNMRPTSNTQLIYCNDSGGNRTVTFYIVPSGSVPGATNQISAALVIPTASRQNCIGPGGLTQGDSIVINTDANTATQTAWASIIEI